MSSGDRASRIKSAYEAALERLEEQGIEKPREEGLDAELRQQIAAIRDRTKAKLAELEILLDDRLKATQDPAERAAAQQEYVAERSRLEEQADRDIEKIRSGG